MKRFDAPRQAVMMVPGLGDVEAEEVSRRAVELSVQYLPRATGAAAGTLFPIFGPDWFGVEWQHDSIWFQEAGTRPHTLRHVAGKTIPMWVKDRDGELRRKNPNIQTRQREDTGETEVLIFRRAAKIGQRRDEWRVVDGVLQLVSKPMSYPGAPGRIAVNRSRGLMRQGDTTPGTRNRGFISKGNVGVRWRHPGLEAGRYLVRGITDAAEERNIPVDRGVDYFPAGAAAIGEPYRTIVVRQ
jgi:hypothetical protein